MANPRIDELRSRLQREPGSRLFAQLAEELRKDGDLTEAIRVARSGLALHPNYPSARLTLGRALIESGNLTAARTELESVLRGAPDNILASRMLAECLEGLGDLGAALLQFRAALRLSPGDRQIEGQIRALELRLAGPAPVRPAAPPATVPAASAVDGTLPAQERPATQVDGGMTLPSHRAEVGSVAPAAPPVEPRVPVAPPPVAPTAMREAARPGAPSSMPPPVTPVPPPPHAASPAGDFDDVFEAAPSWQQGVGVSGPAAESGPILLLEDEAPTLPGGPFSPPAPAPLPEEPTPAGPRPETASFPAAPAPAGPVTLSFMAPELQSPAAAPGPPQSPVAEGPPSGRIPPGAETLAGAPAFTPFAEAPPEPRSGSPFAPPSPGAAASAPELERPFPPPSLTPPGPAPAPVPAAVAPSTSDATPALRSATLAELYLEQGFPDKAVEVYEQLLEGDPYDQRARSRLIEIKRLSATTPAAPALREVVPPPAILEEAAPPPAVAAPPEPAPLQDDPHAPRRRALERTIARLEQMLVAVRRE